MQINCTMFYPDNSTFTSFNEFIFKNSKFYKIETSISFFTKQFLDVSEHSDLKISG